MTELPEIVRQRLAQPAGGDHPDPDLLAAFAEGTLGERERTRVLGHLSACAACREVVSLALPETPVPEPARAARHWLRWPVLRWGAAAAAVVIVGTAVMLRAPRRARVMDDDTTISQAKQETTAPAKLAEPKLRQGDSRTAAKGDVVASQLRAPKPQGRNELRTPVAGPRKEAQALVARKAAPSPAGVAGVPANGVAGYQQPYQQQAAPGLAQQSVPQAVPAADQAAQANGAVGGGVGGLQQQAQMNMAQQAAPAQAQSAPPPTARRDIYGLDRAEVVPAAPPAAQAETAVSAQDAVKTKSLMMRVSAVPRWRVSNDGRLEQSRDAGQTWHAAPVAGGAKLRAVSAVGNDVWAGGAAGALYHSSNGGVSWTRMVPRSGEVTLTSDIVRVEFTDILHGTVTTAPGEIWVTANGGRTWTVRQP